MTDEALLNELARIAIDAGYRAHGVPGDGNCQFHALLAALRGAVEDGIIDASELARASVDGVLDAGTLRARLVDWLAQNGDKELGNGRGTLRMRINQVRNDWFGWDKYLAKMRTDKPDESGEIEWGDENTLMAFSLMFKLTLKVISLNSAQAVSTIARPPRWSTATRGIVYVGYKAAANHYWAFRRAVPLAPALAPAPIARASAAGLDAARVPFAAAALPPVVSPRTPLRTGSAFSVGPLLAGAPARLDVPRSLARLATR